MSRGVRENEALSSGDSEWDGRQGKIKSSHSKFLKWNWWSSAMKMTEANTRKEANHEWTNKILRNNRQKCRTTSGQWPPKGMYSCYEMERKGPSRERIFHIITHFSGSFIRASSTKREQLLSRAWRISSRMWGNALHSEELCAIRKKWPTRSLQGAPQRTISATKRKGRRMNEHRWRFIRSSRVERVRLEFWKKLGQLLKVVNWTPPRSPSSPSVTTSIPHGQWRRWNGALFKSYVLSPVRQTERPGEIERRTGGKY